MEVGPAEAEGRHPCAPFFTGGRKPGPGFVKQINGGLRIGDCVDGVVHTHMGRQHLVMQRQGDLDQAGDTRCCLGVPDDGLDRAQGDGLCSCALSFQCAGDGLRLGLVAHRRTGAMRLDQAQRCGPEARLGIGPVQGAHLSFRTWRRHPQCLAIRGARNRLDDGINAVAIAFGVGEALQDQYGGALRNHDAIGALVETAGRARGGQGLGLGEAEVAERTLDGVHTASQGDVCASGFEVVNGQADSRQRGGAGRVDGEVAPPKVQAIGDATGSHVLEHTGEGFLRPLRQPVPDRVRRCVDKAWNFRPNAVLHAQVADATAGAEHDAGVLAVEIAICVAGVRQRAMRGLQAKQLHGVDGLHRLGRNAEGQGIEGNFVEKAAPFGIHLVAGGLVGVVVQLPIPSRLGHEVGDLALVQDDVPEVFGIVCLG